MRFGFVALAGRPRVSQINYVGIKKSERDDLEKKLGYKLFVNLEKKVGAETYKQIKEENPATVSWWWQ